MFRGTRERTPLVNGGGGRGGRVRSEYEDLDQEAFNSWGSKSYTYLIHEGGGKGLVLISGGR